MDGVPFSFSIEMIISETVVSDANFIDACHGLIGDLYQRFAQCC